MDSTNDLRAAEEEVRRDEVNLKRTKDDLARIENKFAGDKRKVVDLELRKRQEADKNRRDEEQKRIDDKKETDRKRQDEESRRREQPRTNAA